MNHLQNHMLVNYSIINKLSEQGCFSEVFLAKDEQLNREIIVKEISKDTIKSDDYFEESKKLYNSKHQNIVEIYFAGFKEKYIAGKQMTHICLCMPYYKNGSLEQKIKNKEIKETQILKIMMGLLQGVHHIHSKKLIHLDLKPDNILFDDKMNPLISDFGVSKYLNNKNIVEEPIMPIYLKSPESSCLYLECYKNVESAQTDIYQLGIIFYLILTKKTFQNFAHDINSKINQNGNQDVYKNDILKIIKNGDCFDFDIIKNRKEIKILKKMLNIDPKKRYLKILNIINDLSKIK